MLVKSMRGNSKINASSGTYGAFIALMQTISEYKVRHSWLMTHRARENVSS